MYTITMKNKNTGEVKVVMCKTREQRAKHLPDPSLYSYYLTDTNIENEFDELVFD